MPDEIKVLTAELARDPESLAFLELGEALRRRGQLDHALRVVEGGLERHPRLVDALDLHARILVDLGRFAPAEREWTSLLERAPRHRGAHKGLGFLSFRAGDLDRALDHLEIALSEDPQDQSVVRALHLVRNAVAEGEAVGADQPPQSSMFVGLEGAEQRMLLVDERGLVLGGGLVRRDGQDVAEEVAAYLAGVAQEASRTARLLGLGTWEWIVAEGGGGHLYVTSPTEDTLLLIARDRTVPSGRLGLLAERATEVARRWLEVQIP